MLIHYNFHKRIVKKDHVRNRDEYFLKKCKNKKVLHIGAADWPYTEEKHKKGDLLYLKIDKVAKHQLGIDTSKEGINYLKKLDTKNSDITFFDLNTEGDINYNPDVIVFGETLEHLMNLSTALSNIKKLMRKDTELLISVPNALNFAEILLALLGHEQQHPDHKVAFTYKTITQLLYFNGFKIEDVKFTWLFRYPGSLNWKGKLIYILPVFISKIFPLYSGNIIVVAKK